jgi:hypothetical protein
MFWKYIIYPRGHICILWQAAFCMQNGTAVRNKDCTNKRENNWKGCIFLEKLTVAQLLKKLSTFYGTRKFLTVLLGSRPGPDQSNPHPPSTEI